jgi:hypothetical protein
VALIDKVKAHWKLDETSGNGLDAHGSNTLTPAGTVGTGAGKINTARTFGGAGLPGRLEIADNADLSSGDIEFGITGWLKLNALVASGVVSKWTTPSRGYALFFPDTSGVLQWKLSSDGSSDTLSLNASNFGALSTGVWYFFAAWHDSVNNEAGVSINGVTNTTSFSTGVFDSTANFILGSFGGFLDGLLDEVTMFKPQPTSGERTELYNSGNGFAYPFASGPANLKTRNGLATASIKTINGLAIASVKTYNGVA